MTGEPSHCHPVSLDAEGESSPFYADGIVYFRSVTNNGYSGDLEIALIPEWFRTEILQEQLDDKGVLIEKSSNAESVKFALLFEFDGDETEILELWGANMVTDIEAKKGLAEVSGK